MPKIKTDSFYIAGKEYRMDIYFSEKQGFYINKGIPEGMDSVVNLKNEMGVNKIGRYNEDEKFKTIDTLRSSLKKKIEEYEKLIQQKRKVIYVELGINNRHIENLFGDKKYGYHENDPYGDVRRTHTDHKLGFDLGYSIGFEYSTGSEKSYTEIINGRESKCSVGSRDKIIEWTEEREKFFIALESNMDAMCKKLIEFFNTDQLTLNIDRGQKLLG